MTMIDKLRNIFRKYPILFKRLSDIYQVFIAPIESGHFQYYLKYLFTIRHNEKKKLKKYGFKKIKPIAHKEWRIGQGKDNAYRRYYIGEYEERKCFIKIGKNDATVENEYLFGKNLKQVELKFSPRFITGDNFFDDNTTMLAIEYLDGLHKFSAPVSVEKFANLCKQFNDILDELFENNIVHADIHKGNLMTQNEKLVLMDYGISMKKDIGNKIDYKARPGTFYRDNCGKRTYDDAFSFVEMINRLGLPEKYLNVKEYKDIVSKIGRNYINIKL